MIFEKIKKEFILYILLKNVGDIILIEIKVINGFGGN